MIESYEANYFKINKKGVSLLDCAINNSYPEIYEYLLKIFINPLPK